jgi:hypothetical protein
MPTEVFEQTYMLGPLQDIKLGTDNLSPIDQNRRSQTTWQNKTDKARKTVVETASR